MKKIALAALAGASALGIAACHSETTVYANNTAAAAGTDTTTVETTVPTATTTSTVFVWPREARIVEEKGVTYRIEPNGTRVTLTDTDSHIVVDNGVRYRVDPGGARVRIDERGVGLDVEPPSVAVSPTPQR